MVDFASKWKLAGLIMVQREAAFAHPFAVVERLAYEAMKHKS